MNEVILTGTIRNCRPSHTIGNINYSRCELVQGDNIIDVVYKEGQGKLVQEGMEKSICGQLRSKNSSSHVNLYVSSYLDDPEQVEENLVKIDGIIIKKDNLYVYPNGKCNQHIVIKNNIVSNIKEFSNSIPCISRNALARITDNLNIGDKVEITGKLTSRTYVKNLPDGEQEIKVTHEVLVENIS